MTDMTGWGINTFSKKGINLAERKKGATQGSKKASKQKGR